MPATITMAATSSLAPHVATPCSGVKISPGANLQATFDAHPSGTTFCFSAGTYVVTGHVLPKSFDRLISATRRLAVLTGSDRYDGGIEGYGGAAGQHDVLVQGFVIHHFDNPWPNFPRSPLQTGDHWTVRDNEISYNSESGVSVSLGSRLVGNWIHHNGRYGFTGGPLTDLVAKNNDVSFNNTRHYDPNDDAGGSKIVQSSGVVFSGNYVHDNYGNGLWCDWQNIDVTYAGNTLERNYLAGIFHEASANAVIRDNAFSRNGLYATGKSIWFSADLLLNDSKNTQIYRNKIVAGVNGIGLIDVDRGSDKYGLLEIRNDSVHDNTVTLPDGGTSGMVSNRQTAYTPANNHFTHNTYNVTNAQAASWSWPPSGDLTWSRWKLAGNDVTGVLRQ
jgi:parallel beta-helix repeat protein